MDAGQEMDRLVAERVFGERVERESGCLWLDGPEPMRLTRPLPAYSTDIAAAWQVVGRMTEQGFVWFCLQRMPDDPAGLWCAMFKHSDGRDGYSRYVSAPTDALAICRAALGEFGVEV